MTMTTSTSSARSAMTLFRERHGTNRGMPVFDAEGGATGVSDEAAALLREVMALKASNRAAAERLAQFTAAGATPEHVAQLKADAAARVAQQAQAEQEKVITAENWDSVKANMAATHKAEKQAVLDQLAAAQKATADADSTVRDLSIGAAFHGSKFLAEQTMLPGSKARKLYGDHFDFENGKVVAYDAPHGAGSRAPLVDGTGQPLPFDVAMKCIVDGDPDRDQLMRPNRTAGKSKGKEPAHVGAGVDRIAAGLRERNGNTDDAPGASLAHRDTYKPQPVTTAAHRDMGPSRITEALRAGSLPASSRGGPVRTSP